MPKLSRALLLVGLWLGDLSNAHASDPLLGNCHMEVCSWSRELSRDLVGSSSRGALFELVLLGGSSFHRDGRYERKTPIKWNAKPHKSHVFCSKTMPLVMGTYDGTFQADFLQIGTGVIGAYLSSLSLYGYVCHNTAIKDEATLAKQYGYKPSLEQFEAIEGKLTGPESVLRLP
jgi:hypothetical protein